MDTNKLGGTALVVGFLVVLLVLYRDPVGGWNAATDGVATAVYFLMLPVAGLLAGVYAYADGPYNVAPLFLFGSYLGMFGIALALGSLLGPNPNGVILGVGVVLSGLSLAALVAGLMSTTASVPLDALRPSSN